ncbi:MAG TPA: hypothetical protein VEA80_12430 [Vitreimonas sp.]|uniref:hypothetical protein n=1 Tax=Vitreimonas sp. TaxID=3069702 RepID=UPI002D33F785|nr:hypothetical protein [Vitreimonas sp.]HYD88278.1 hypothetical protein [Vitreimonas sp.]
MSRRPPVAAAADARPDGPSRRTLIGGATAAPLFAGALSAPTDHAIVACENWLALDAEYKRLSRRWQKLEAQLAREQNFLKLSRRQQRALPQAQELYQIDDRLEELWEEQETLLKILPTLAATSALGLAGKLAVAATHICKDENEEDHHLIASILRDFKAMTPEGAS